MRVVHLSTADEGGGAARSAYRLNSALADAGVESWMIVQRRDSGSPHVLMPGGRAYKLLAQLRPHVDQLPARLYRARRGHLFTSAFIPGPVTRLIRRLRPDVVNLHWVGGGFISIEQIAKIDAPLVWTLHDAWPFTGGCHLTGGCRKYESACGGCPALGSRWSFDLSRIVFLRKARALKQTSLRVVAPSQWLASCASESALFGELHVEVIPNGVDTTCYRPHERTFARRAFGLPEEAPLLLYYASDGFKDPNKGFDLLVHALRGVADEVRREDARLVVAGSATPPASQQDIPVGTISVGRLRDDVSLSLLNAAVDAILIPSRSENLPNVGLEAIACGRPIVGFGIGGLQDMVCSGEDGILAAPFDVDAFGEGILWVIRRRNDQDIERRLRAKAVKRYSLATYAKQYQQLYTSCMRDGAPT